MKKQLQLMFIFISLGLLTFFVIVVINQTNQVVILATTIDPRFGQVVLYGLLAIYALFILVPIIIFLRLPGALRPPAVENSPEFELYLQKLAARLATNRHLAGTTILANDRASIETALEILHGQANELIQRTASTIFISTAISQNGRLDALMVLSAQSRLVWQLAHLYYQRPSWRDMLYLYANVAATTLLVSEIEDLDISEQVEPMVTAALSGALAGLVPGVSLVSSVMMSSALEGTANAFLTLRVGIVTRNYCASLTTINRKLTRRIASAEAMSLLGAIVLTAAGVVSLALANATKNVAVNTATSVGQSVVEGASAMTEAVVEVGRKVGEVVGVISPNNEEEATTAPEAA